MKQILDMYRMLKIAEREISWRDNLTIIKFDRGGRALNSYLSSAYVKDEFRKKYKRKTYSDIENAYEDALLNGYIENRYIEDRIPSLKGKGKLLSKEQVEQFQLTPKGRNLTDNAIFIIPIGLLYAWFEKYGAFLSGIGVGSLAGGLIVGLGGAILKWIILPLITAYTK